MLLGLLGSAAPRAQMEAGEFSAPQRDYILACAGCHGIQGVSNPDLVPSLQGLVGYFLELPEGRAYLSRLPNVAFSTLSDERLAAVLNYMVFEIGRRQRAGWGPGRTLRPRSGSFAGSRSRKSPCRRIAGNSWRP